MLFSCRRPSSILNCRLELGVPTCTTLPPLLFWRETEFWRECCESDVDISWRENEFWRESESEPVEVWREIAVVVMLLAAVVIGGSGRCFGVDDEVVVTKTELVLLMVVELVTTA